MASIYTAHLNAPKITQSQSEKESDIGRTFDIFDSVLAGKYRLNVAAVSSPLTLSEDDSHYSRFEFHGTRASALEVRINPKGARKFTVENEATTQTITVKVTSGGAGVAISTNQTAELEHDDTDVFSRDAAPVFTAPTLLNSWVDFGGVNAPAGYYKRHGRVYLRGLIKSGTIGAAAFNLPVGYRPAYYQYFSVPTYNYVHAVVYVQDNGDVFIHDGNNTFISLDGISFAVA